MKIYTRTGDKGTTSLIGGARVPKHHLRIECYGTVDELNAYIGLIAGQEIEEMDKQTLKQIQKCLFITGSLLAADPDGVKMQLPELQDSDIVLLENEIDRMDKVLPQLRHFILPGGNNTISFCHIARCVCRRAERIAVQLAEESNVDSKVIIYLNRLSDYLFILARLVGQQQQVAEYKWIT